MVSHACFYLDDQYIYPNTHTVGFEFISTPTMDIFSAGKRPLLKFLYDSLILINIQVVLVF